MSKTSTLKKVIFTSKRAERQGFIQENLALVTPVFYIRNAL
ncbi:hypothetical protein [Corynebacterium callunae]|nr:hypothetical protein [Corynebacterium callunae]